MSASRGWDMWVDFGRVYDALTYGDLRDAEVVEVRGDGVVLLKVLPGHADSRLALLQQQPA